MRIYFFFKRLIGIMFSLIALSILWPVLICIAIAIKLDSPGPVIFVQERIGRWGNPYKMYKFRSMVKDAQKQGTGIYTFKDDIRVTRVGKILRKTSLDELPQLVNILKGDMGFVGPRSPIAAGFPPYSELNERFKRRFSVLPGVTGLAQVVGRNDFSWDEKVEFDNQYIDKISKYGLLFDLKILLLTVVRVFSMASIEEDPENMEKNKLTFNSMIEKSTTNLNREE